MLASKICKYPHYQDFYQTGEISDSLQCSDNCYYSISDTIGDLTEPDSDEIKSTIFSIYLYHLKHSFSIEKENYIFSPPRYHVFQCLHEFQFALVALFDARDAVIMHGMGFKRIHCVTQKAISLYSAKCERLFTLYFYIITECKIERVYNMYFPFWVILV